MLYCVILLIEMFLLDIYKLPCCCTYVLPEGLGWKVSFCQLYDTPANRLMMDQPRKLKVQLPKPILCRSSQCRVTV